MINFRIKWNNHVKLCVNSPVNSAINAHSVIPKHSLFHGASEKICQYLHTTQTRHHNNIQKQCYNTISTMCSRDMPTTLISLWKCFRFPVYNRILSDFRVIFTPIDQMSGITHIQSEGRPQRLYLCVWTLKSSHILIQMINLKHFHRLCLLESSLFKQSSYLPLYVDRFCLLYTDNRTRWHTLLCFLLCYVLFSLS